MRCPICDGEGELLEDIIEYTRITYPCGYCKGTGSLSVFGWLSHLFWEHVPVEFIEWCDKRKESN